MAMLDIQGQESLLKSERRIVIDAGGLQQINLLTESVFLLFVILPKLR